MPQTQTHRIGGGQLRCGGQLPQKHHIGGWSSCPNSDAHSAPASKAPIVSLLPVEETRDPAAVDDVAAAVEAEATCFVFC
ncbi:hypothetical protein WN943_005992 [Citrus x changshan-huyou]